MSRHFLVDGYNLLYALPEMPTGTWQEKRGALLRLFRERRPQGRNPVTVVFDGQEGGYFREIPEGLEVIFTAGETADDWISRKVREVSNAGVLTVVTDDQGLRHMIGGTGARWMATSEFLKKS